MNAALTTATELAEVLAHGGVDVTVTAAYRGQALIIRGSQAVFVGIDDNVTILSACTKNEVFTGPSARFTHTPVGVLAAVAAAYLGA